MTTYSKPSVRSSWGQTATPADLQDPGDTFASKGWQLGPKPPRQYFNWVLNYIFAGVRYLCQQGIATWDSSETYPVYAITQGAANKALYYSLINGNTTNPETTGADQVHWDVPYIPSPPGSDRSARAANTGWVGQNFLPLAAPFNALSGSIFPSQVPVGAITQWQGSLSIAGSQVSSAVARANTLALAGGYATFNWAGGPGVQPQWAFGSNDGSNIYVWNPSNFSVANSQALQGLLPNVSAVGNAIMVRDAGGYAYVQYLNQASPNNENVGSSINQVLTTNGGDNFLRKASLVSVVGQMISQFGLLTPTSFASLLAPTGFISIPSSTGGKPFILQWGSVFTSGNNPTQVTVIFPTAFVSQCFIAGCNTLRATGGAQGSNFVASKSATGAVFVFDNVASPPNTVGGYWWAIGQ